MDTYENKQGRGDAYPMFSTQQAHSGPGGEAPPDYLIKSIAATIFCCWPIGIFAVLNGLESRDAYYRGNSEQAAEKSKKSKKLLQWTVGVGVVVIILALILYLFALPSGHQQVVINQQISPETQQKIDDIWVMLKEQKSQDTE